MSSDIQTPTPQPASQAPKSNRIQKNLLSNGTTMVVTMLVGLWYTPYMLEHLSASAFGLVPLATSITSYLSIVTVSIAGSVGRFVMADVARGDLVAANKTLNAFFIGGMVALATLVLVSLAFCIVLPIKVPPELTWEARVLFFAILTSFLIGIPAALFDVSVWVTNRFEIRAAADLLGLAVRLAVLISLFNLVVPSVWHVGLAVQAGAWTNLLVLAIAFRRLTPQLKISRSFFDRRRMTSIAASANWLMVYQFANIVSLGFDMFFINRVLGTEANTKYSVVLVWVSALRGALSAIAIVLAPKMVTMESTGQTIRLTELTLMTGRLQGAAASAAVGTLCGLGPWLFAIWLRKPWTDEVIPIAWILLIPLCIEASVAPLGPILIAEGRMRQVAVATGIIGITGAALGWILIRWTSLGMIGVAIAVAMTVIGRHGLFTSIFAADTLGAPRLAYVRMCMTPVLKALLFGGVAYLIGIWLHPDSRISLLTTAALAGTVVLILSFFLLQSPERLAMKRLMHLA